MKAVGWPWWTFDSGAAVGALFARVLALISLCAWLSLGAQVQILIGSRGLLPFGEFMRAVQAEPGASIFQLPTIFWWFHGDAALTVGVALGSALSIAALAGFRSRLCFASSTALYLSFAVVGRDFLSFQWDNLLLECGLLAAFLPTRAPAPTVHFLFRLLLFKLYFESGVAKWQSPIDDWRDGSAMTYYYQTAPLPTWLAFHAHHLPIWWHHFESRATLVLELVAIACFLVSLGAASQALYNVWGVLLLLGVIVAGIVVPFLLQRRANHGIVLPAVLVLVGGFLLRTVIVLSSERIHVVGTQVVR